MKFNFFILVFGLYIIGGQAQTVPQALDPQFDRVIKRYLDFSVTPVSVDKAYHWSESSIFLDTREFEEFEVSHIKGARHVGFEEFDPDYVKDIEPGARIILYCSIGYRSEKIGEKLKGMGYSNLYNLYGSIFEWVNNGYPVFDNNENPTKEVHTYTKSWSKWVNDDLADKRW